MTKAELENIENIHLQFLERWNLENIKRITINEYVGIRNKDTFCQWVETKTRILGSIKGMSSIKFGIYERDDKKKTPKNFNHDFSYSWSRKYNKERNVAFNEILNDIIQIIEFSIRGDFENIDAIKLPDLFKWKIAFLYSNERLIPIFNRKVLKIIANHLGLPTSRNTKISKIQNLMISKKPSDLSVYEYMWLLYSKFGGKENEVEKKVEFINGEKKEIKRKSSNKKNTLSHIRTVSGSFIIDQKHNKIQEILKRNLEKEFGGNCVFQEENFVDIKLVQNEYIALYEVKSSSYASKCIRDALGQILLYSFKEKDERPRKHIVVGQYPPNESDKEYINFLKNNLKLEFEYINIELS